MTTAVRYQYMPPLSPETRYTAWDNSLMLDLSPAGLDVWHVTLVRGGSDMAQTRTPIGQLDAAELIASLGVHKALRFSARPCGDSELPPYQDEPATDQRDVYFIEGAGLIKIGVADNPRARLDSLQCGSPVPLRLLAVLEDQGIHGEASLHGRFASQRRRGEWFEPNDELPALIASARPLDDSEAPDLHK